MKINFHLELCGVLLLSLFIGAGCGDQTVCEETPETMIGGLARLAEDGASWEVLSGRGMQTVEAIFAVTNAVERRRHLESLRRTMRTLREPQERGPDGEEARRRRIWALRDTCFRMSGYKEYFKDPEEAVEDWLFVLSEYRRELKRFGPVDCNRTYHLQARDAESLRHKAYSEVENDLGCDAPYFEKLVLPKVLPNLSLEQRKRIEERFNEIVGRPLLHLGD